MAKIKSEKVAKATKKARVLLALSVNGVAYQPNQIIEADDDLLNALVGQVDPHPDAVAYCEGIKNG
ncbi:hypothetical protein SAMN05216420_101392 [Nitrosospira sp. Nl5]|uniref:hypothetical protein n=1 Tax=Nitrosospira sp. Nl5 TaxID=200120 RepID=UPI00087E9DAC|nr:hypothetical protein [Nitrosospira sp. Nl5]SCX93961.1 hypothetical protein SAMN05216420_101392 [Nitrosospira sp. Nl5]